MFTKARLKLTIWYAIMIMVVSVSFSLVIYRSVSFEFERGLRRVMVFQNAKGMGMIPPPPGSGNVAYGVAYGASQPLPDQVKTNLADLKHRIILVLVLINSVIVLAALGLGYLVAGLTLKPIEKAHRQQKRFIADASHELKTPLAVMKTSLEVLLRNKQAKLTDYQKSIKSILEEVDELKDLTENLLTLSNPTKFNQLENVDISKSIKQAAAEIAPIAQKKHIEIETKVARQLIAKLQPMILKKFWLIFLDNAVKYSKPGDKVTISAQEKKGLIQVKITDHGLGIPKKDLAFIFDRFYRVDSSRSTVAGFGLGLSIAKQIADQYGIKIEVVSILGKGSSFIISLPAN